MTSTKELKHREGWPKDCPDCGTKCHTPGMMRSHRCRGTVNQGQHGDQRRNGHTPQAR